MSDFRVGYEPKSLEEIARFGGYQQQLASHLKEASKKGAQLIVHTIPKVTTWKNGNGILDHSFYVAQSSVYESAVRSDLPYAHRRNDGFSGQTDSLGRFYPHDPGAHYVEKTFDRIGNEIEDIYATEVNAAFTATGF